MTLVAAAALAILPTASAQAAPLNITPLITYNMLGATSGQDSKWTTTIGDYIQAAEIVTLQEAGPTPPGLPVNNITVPGLPPVGRAGFIQHHRWQFGHASYEVYFLQTDRWGGSYVGGRNNIAVVTQREPDEVTAVPSPVAGGRAALGVRFGDDWYFTFHGRPTGTQEPDNESEQMLADIASFVNRVPGRAWTVGADFNNEPGRFPVPVGAQIYSTGLPTHDQHRELDYVVSSTRIQDHPTRRLNGASSDHYAVAVGGLRASAEPHSLFTSPRSIENMQNGGVLRSAMDGSRDGESVTTADRDGEPGQHWDLEYDGTQTARIRLAGGRCLNAEPDSPGHYMPVLRDCSAHYGQRWRLLSFGNEQYQIRSAALGLCLDVGTSHSPQDTSRFQLGPCQNLDSQHWYLAPTADSNPNVNFSTGDLPVAHSGPFGLENIQTGRMMAAEPLGLPGTHVRAYLHRNQPNPNQEQWVPQWTSSTELRMRDPLTDRCAEMVPFESQQGLAAVDMQPCNSSLAQTWVVDPVSEDTFRLKNKSIIFFQVGCLDLAPRGSFTGDIVDATDCASPKASQRWFFAPFDTTGGPDEPGDSTTKPPLKVMVVGDSMSEGMEGDWTWRYRLWQWFKDQHVPVDFVGPYRGTKQPDPTGPPAPPRLQSEPPENPSVANPPVFGAYSQDIEPGFDSDHFAVWGRQAAQDKDLIGPMVAQYKPDLILFGIGFNDMGWLVSDAHGTLDSMKVLVDRARAAKPDVKMAVANVPQRLFIDGRQDLVDKTDQYNALLKDAIPTWSTPASPVKLVDWAGGYACAPAKCSAGYDGLHPNLIGEYQIAYAYARTLNREFGIGESVPESIATFPDRPISPVSGLKAESVPSGIKVTWDPVFGARGYAVRYRLVGAANWNEVVVPSNRFDTTWTEDGWTWEYQVRTYNYTDGASAWKPATATAHPETAPPPPNISTSPNSTGMDVYWDTPTGPHTDTIDRYEVITWDKDVPGGYVASTAVTNNQARINGLVPGHHYLVAVATWNKAGGGMPGMARSVTIGAGVPPVPTDVTVTSLDATTVRLNWKGSPEAAGYRVWVRNVNEPEGSNTQDPYITDSPEHQIAFLFPGNWNFEFCISAFNGSLESGKSSCVHVPMPPPSTDGNPPPSNNSDRAQNAADEPLLELGRAAAAQRNLDAAAPIG
ncbi:ricin-type beta-trefoil lectin domain protein [Streptomyces sp. NPDC096324]|uniref:ricin-type beta-trefoil lectin domain protein n=1 Tax=Streptomyces sp. NPDC096324 TaxID=3366085 RepID=UPI003803AEEC